MLLVPSRPIPLPVLRPGRGWYDDFAVTGAKSQAGLSYTVQAESAVPVSRGIEVRAVAETSGGPIIPPYTARDGLIESRQRLLAGNIHIRPIFWRRSNDANQWALEITAASDVKLIKVVANVWTTVATKISAANPYEQHTYAASFVGPRHRVYIDGKLIFDVTDTANLMNTGFKFCRVEDSAVGVTKGLVEYLAIHPL